MMAYVVDTNIAVVANGRESPQADPDCVLACINNLQAIYNGAVIALDATGLILDEYMDNLSMSGQPGAGDYFMKWVYNIQADESRCEQVKITRVPHDPSDFNEFPRDTALAKFDRKDRKFAAVALASRNQPTILNAVDPDWAQCETALARHGVKIQFLCPQCVSPET